MSYPGTRARMRELRCSMDTEPMVDRFSDLPDGVAHHILSFLWIKDLIRFGVVSKRCRALYFSAPVLNFNDENANTCDKWLSMSESLSRFLSLRSNNRIQIFRIVQQFYHDFRESSPPCFCDQGKSQSLMWIKMAARFNMVEVLDLQLVRPNVETPVSFPSSIFSCASLRSLSVGIFNTIIEAPSAACLSNLQCLNLQFVAVAEGFFKWISSSCKCLKELHLKHLAGESEVITIESSSLERFCILSYYKEHCELQISGEKLQGIQLEYLHCNVRKDSLPGTVNIFAPNLKYLGWFGYPASHMLGKSWCLGKAEIFLCYGGKNISKVLEVLRSACRVKVLTLYVPTIWALVDAGLSTPKPFEHVSNLQLKIGSFTDDIVPAIASVFRLMPILTTLNINSNPEAVDRILYLKSKCSAFDMGYWKSQNLAFISELENVTLDISRKFRGSNAIEFSRFILENAKNLKKLVIVHSPRFPKWAVRKLNKSEKTSNARVVFHIKK